MGKNKFRSFTGKENQNGKVLFYTYDSFHPRAYGEEPLDVGDSVEPLHLKYVWQNSKPLKDISNLFSDRSNFQGRSFSVGTVTWAHFVLGYPTPKDDPTYSNTTKYRNFYGYEISMLEIASKKLNFTYKIFNSINEWTWLGLSQDKKEYLGIMPDAGYGVTDISMGECFATEEGNNILDNLSVRFDDEFMTMVTPLPRPISKTTALVTPFGPFVWIYLILTFGCIVGTLTAISRCERKIKGIHFKEWNTLQKSFFFCFATLTTESSDAVVTVKGSAAIRYVHYKEFLSYSLHYRSERDRFSG